MKTTITAIYNLFASMHPAVRGVLGIAVLLLAINQYLNEQWASLFAKVDSIVAPSLAGTADFSPLGLINYVFPLDSCLTFMSAFAVLRGATAVVRIVKSFIPTIA